MNDRPGVNRTCCWRASRVRAGPDPQHRFRPTNAHGCSGPRCGLRGGLRRIPGRRIRWRRHTRKCVVSRATQGTPWWGRGFDSTLGWRCDASQRAGLSFWSRLDCKKRIELSDRAQRSRRFRSTRKQILSSNLALGDAGLQLAQRPVDHAAPEAGQHYPFVGSHRGQVWRKDLELKSTLRAPNTRSTLGNERVIEFVLGPTTRAANIHDLLRPYERVDPTILRCVSSTRRVSSAMIRRFAASPLGPVAAPHHPR